MEGEGGGKGRMQLGSGGCAKQRCWVHLCIESWGTRERAVREQGEGRMIEGKRGGDHCDSPG